MEKNTQVIKCHCGEIFAACVEPYCYQEKEWIKEPSEYSKKGYKIEMQSGGVKFGNCICEKKPDIQLNLL